MRAVGGLHGPRRGVLAVVVLLALAPGTFFGAGARVLGAQPANRDAGPKARAVLDFFHDLAARTEGRRLLSGQFSGYGQAANLGLVESIHAQTGHWPAVIGVDYADFSRGSLTYERPNQVAIAHARAGGLVTVSAHLYNPANPKGGGLRDPGVDLDRLLAADGDPARRWREELELLADGLQQLKAAGVVVLWRPFHEMNGDWFWWGAKAPEAFVRVWRHMFEHFSRVRGLDHLLWVYGPNHGANTARYYPGDGFVDLVGLDAYTDFVDPAHIRGYADVAALPKPFGFTEFGPHGSRNPPGDYDYRRLLVGLREHFPKARFFKCWNDQWSLATNRYTKELLSDPVVINREDLPPGLGVEAR